MPVRNFSRLAIVFVALFVVLVLGNFFPVQLLDPSWQSRLVTVLVNAGSLPLTALALMQLARHLDPIDQHIKKQQQTFSRLAIVVVYAYLLLVPLQISAGLRLHSRDDAEQRNLLARAERQLADLRQALNQASSNADLSARFKALSGPIVSPAELALPQPVLKAQVSLAIDQAQVQIQRDRNALRASNPLRLLPEFLRSTISCLVLAFGFAIFARSKYAKLSMIDSLRASSVRARWWQRFRTGRRPIKKQS